MQGFIVGQRIDRTDPDKFQRRRLYRACEARRLDRLEFEGTLLIQHLQQHGGQIRHSREIVLEIGQRFGQRHFGHGNLVMQAGLGDLEGRRHVEYLLTVLNGDDPPHGKMLAVPGSIHFVDDRRAHIPAPQKIRVQRVHFAIFHRRRRRHQRLAQHLAAENLGTADVAALSAKQIDLEALESHHLDQVFE